MKRTPTDYTGQRFGRLTVLRPASDWSADRHPYWWCRCDCGTEFPTSISSVIRGKTISCGCYRSERARALCSQNFRRCTPCEVTFPDGSVGQYVSANSAHYATGHSVKTICSHIRTGKPLGGYTYKQI